MNVNGELKIQLNELLGWVIISSKLIAGLPNCIEH